MASHRRKQQQQQGEGGPQTDYGAGGSEQMSGSEQMR
jgi:hypothetical protein